MSRNKMRAQYGLVAAFSREWHALREEEEGRRTRKDNSLRVSPVSAPAVSGALRYNGPGTNIHFMAFYRNDEERALLVDAIAALKMINRGINLVLPPSATEPILRVGRYAHCDVVFLAERNLESLTEERSDGVLTRQVPKVPAPPPFLFSIAQIPQQ